MLEGPLFSGIMLYTIPIILTSVLQLLFNAADLVVVGRSCGSISVAAVGATGFPQWLYISYPVSWLITFLFQLIVFPRISQTYPFPCAMRELLKYFPKA